MSDLFFCLNSKLFPAWQAIAARISGGGNHLGGLLNVLLVAILFDQHFLAANEQANPPPHTHISSLSISIESPTPYNDHTLRPLSHCPCIQPHSNSGLQAFSNFCCSMNITSGKICPNQNNNRISGSHAKAVLPTPGATACCFCCWRLRSAFIRSCIAM